MAKKDLKVVKLLEPEMCSECRFSDIARVQMKSGEVQTMIHCRRLDCDNWDYSSAEETNGVLPLDDAA